MRGGLLGIYFLVHIRSIAVILLITGKCADSVIFRHTFLWLPKQQQCFGVSAGTPETCSPIHEGEGVPFANTLPPQLEGQYLFNGMDLSSSHKPVDASAIKSHLGMDVPNLSLLNCDSVSSNRSIWEVGKCLLTPQMGLVHGRKCFSGCKLWIRGFAAAKTSGTSGPLCSQWALP